MRGEGEGDEGGPGAMGRAGASCLSELALGIISVYCCSPRLGLQRATFIGCRSLGKVY